MLSDRIHIRTRGHSTMKDDASGKGVRLSVDRGCCSRSTPPRMDSERTSRVVDLFIEGDVAGRDVLWTGQDTVAATLLMDALGSGLGLRGGFATSGIERLSVCQHKRHVNWIRVYL